MTNDVVENHSTVHFEGNSNSFAAADVLFRHLGQTWKND